MKAGASSHSASEQKTTKDNFGKIENYEQAHLDNSKRNMSDRMSEKANAKKKKKKAKTVITTIINSGIKIYKIRHYKNHAKRPSMVENKLNTTKNESINKLNM